MKLIAIGDVHSRPIYKQIIDYHKNADKIVFLGDYADPYYDAGEWEIISTVINIIQFKKDNPDKVELLIGNHDAHYIWKDEIEPCTRYDEFLSPKLQKLFTDNLDLFTLAYKIDNNLFTHAGISTKWLNRNLSILKDNGGLNDLSNIDIVLNNLNKTKEGRDIIHTVGYVRGGWNPADTGGPTWADIDETYGDYLPNINQYVGHSQVQRITSSLNNSGSITYCDTLHKNRFSLKYDVLNIEI